MKTLIFSDTHLTSVFNPLKFDYLRRIITDADHVIINGDFWDRGFATFNQFVHSRWRSLFPLLRSRKAIYLYGNHDQQDWCDQRVAEFSVYQCKEIKLNVGSKQLLVTHGDKITASPELHIPWHSARSFNAQLGSRVEAAGIKLLGNRFQKIGAFSNKSMKLFAQRHLKESEILVCGHSHLPEWSPDENFINSGINRHGCGQYVLIEDDRLRLVMEYWEKNVRVNISSLATYQENEFVGTRQELSTQFISEN
jgi:predicted phosphodiesterase